MKKYKAVIFDMDGTLADTSLGIYNCHKYTMVEMGQAEPTLENLVGVIGGPLLKTYQNKFGFCEEDAKRAVMIYRNRYAQKGIYEAELYGGIKELLEYLKQKGYKIGVATLKAERFAKIMLENMGVAHYFDVIRGVDEKDQLTKAELLKLCIEEMGIEKDRAVLVGDSEFDAIGAQEIGIDFIGVTYGFDFENVEDVSKYKPVYIAISCNDIKNFL